MDRKIWLLMGLVFMLVVSFILIPGSSRVKSSAASGPNWEKILYAKGSDKESLAMLSINGIIQQSDDALAVGNSYVHTSFLAQLENAFSNPDIKGVLIKINSPGGGVYESNEIYNRILELKQKYAKPYVVYMEKIAASGGYYVSLPADTIYANTNTITGSIGVIISTINYNELTEKIGIEEIVFKSGPNKDLLNPMRELNEEEKSIVYSIVEESYQDFLNIFIKHRGFSQEKALQLADGRIYTARQAKAEHIIDEVGELKQAIKYLAELSKLQNPTIWEYRNKELSPIEKLLGIAQAGLKFSSLEARIAEKFKNTNCPNYFSESYPRAMYICDWN